MISDFSARVMAALHEKVTLLKKPNFNHDM
jgi:hypothetical protein